MNQYKRDTRLLWSTLLIFFIIGFTTAPIGNFLPFLREAYGLDYEFSGLLLSAFSVGGLIAVVLSGLLSIWIGRKWSILFWTACLTLGYILLTAGVSVQFLLLFAFIGIGFARGAHINFTGTMISTLPPERSTSGFLLLHGLFALGALLSPLLLVLLVLQGFSWRVTTGVMLCLAVFCILFLWKMDIPALAQAKNGGKSIDSSFFRDKYFWLGAIILLFYVSVEYGIVGWLVTYFQDMGILSADMSLLMNSLFWTMMLAGRLLGNLVSGKISPCNLLAIDAIGMTAFFFLMFFSTSATPVIIGLIGVSFFMATIYPTAYGFSCTNLDGNDFGTSMLSLLPSLGGIVAPALVGFVAEQGGIQQGMGLLVVLTVVLLVVILGTAWAMRKA